MSKNANFGGAQDWKPQVFNFGERGVGSAGSKRVTEGQANRAIQQGKAVDITKKEHATANQHGGLGARAKRIDDDHETLKVKLIDPHVSAAIQRARQAKGWTQTDLARNVSERQSTVTEYENGKAQPNEQVLQRMEKALGVYLRGAKAGQPLEVKQKAPPAAAAAKK